MFLKHKLTFEAQLGSMKYAFFTLKYKIYIINLTVYRVNFDLKKFIKINWS